MPYRNAEATGDGPVTDGMDPYTCKTNAASRTMKEVKFLIRDACQDCDGLAFLTWIQIGCLQETRLFFPARAMIRGICAAATQAA